MRILACDGDIKPALANRPADHADHFFLRFQDWSLFDMKFEIGADIMTARRFVAVVSDPFQLLAKGRAIGVFNRLELVDVENAREHAGAHHGRREAGAFLIGPDADLEGRFGFNLVVVEGAHDFEARQHAQHAVELAAIGLGVEMAADGDRRQCLILARPPREDITERVRVDAAAGVSAPRDEQVPALLVQVGERQPPAPPFRSCADFRHLHQAIPKAVTFDMYVSQFCPPDKIHLKG